jgi:hypothetical protein
MRTTNARTRENNQSETNLNKKVGDYVKYRGKRTIMFILTLIVFSLLLNSIFVGIFNASALATAPDNYPGTRGGSRPQLDSGPSVDDVRYPWVVNISEPMKIIVTITDSNGVNKVYINYTNVHQVTFNASMTASGKDQWSYTIPGQSKGGDVTFFIWVNNTTNIASTTQLRFIHVREQNLPTISDIEFKSEVNSTTEIHINATIEDDTGILEVRLNYTSVSDMTFNVTMKLTAEPYFIYSIPPQGAAGIVSFYIWAIDYEMNEHYTGTFEVAVTIDEPSEILPIFGSISYPEKIAMNTQISVTVNIANDDVVASVYINYTSLDDGTTQVTMTAEGSGNYSYTIPAQGTTGTISFYIIAYNENDSWNMTAKFYIKVFPVTYDIYPPHVVSTLPINNTINVNLDTKVSITFNETMNTSNFSSAISMNIETAYSLSWNNNDMTVELTFSANLSYYSTYTITISTSAKDLFDNYLESPFILSFTTIKTPDSSNDKDKDGMDDTWELKYKLNPNNPADAKMDTDGDSLINLGEFQNGTDPTKKDTDGDSYYDYEELIEGTDPLDPSSYPIRDTYDTDNDGLADEWEITYFKSLNFNSDEDPDNDGYTNLEEFIAGTDPVDSSSKPASGSGAELNVDIVVTSDTYLYYENEVISIEITNNGTATAQGTVQLTILTYTGDIVKIFDLTSENYTFSPGKIIPAYWTQVNDLGIQVSSGLYYIHASVSGYSNTTLVVIIKPSNKMYDWLQLNNTDHMDIVDQAYSNHAIGVSADFRDSKLESNYYLTGLSIQLTSSSKTKIKISISGELDHGTVLILNIDSDGFKIPDNPITDLEVKFDGEIIIFSDAQAVLTATGEKPVYFIALGTSGMQFILYIPHFSEHSVSIENIKEDPDEDPIPWMFIGIGAVIVIIILLVVSSLAYSRAGKIKQEQFYQNYDVDEGRVGAKAPPTGDKSEKSEKPEKSREDEWTKYFSGK